MDDIHKKGRSFLVMNKMKYLIVACLFLCTGIEATAQTSASDVLKNLRNEYEKVRDYVADITAVVNVPNVKLPKMEARLYFKRPDKIHVEADGFTMLPRDVVAFNPSMLGEDFFDAVIQGNENVSGVSCIKLKLLAKSDTIRLQRIMLFVDPNGWLIKKMSTDPGQGGSAEVLFEYTLVDGKYQMPSRISLEMNAPQLRRKRGGDDDTEGKKEKATASVVYRNYKVNKGIKDSIFQEKK